MSDTIRVALLGNPNAGKSALFNKLTGARQKIANYPGVTVERVAGMLALPDGTQMEAIDLPGAYAFDASSPDEDVTRKVVQGEFPGEAEPDILVLVLDAGNLEQHLVFAQEVLALGKPTIVALNMVDMAERDGLKLDATVLSQALGVPVIDHWWQTETGWTIAGNPMGLGLLPVKYGSPAVPMPGYDVQVVDERLLGRDLGRLDTGDLFDDLGETGDDFVLAGGHSGSFLLC